MNNDINIRKLKDTDHSDFIDMSKQFYSMPCCDHQIDVSHFEDTFNLCLKSNTYYAVLIIEHHGITAGYCALAFSYSTEAGGYTVVFDEIYVKDAFQGLGLGHKLFEYVYSNHPAKRYRLEATSSNDRAIKLYTKLGFETLEYIQLIKDIKTN